MVPPIAILGAGPSSLTLARLLTLHNIEYTIFEKDASPTSKANGRIDHGGSLDLRPGSGLQALQEAGLLDKFKTLARYDGQEMRIVDMHGQVVWHHPYTEGDEFNPEIDRGDLRQLLLDSVPAEMVEWGRCVKEVRREGDGSMTVEFADDSVTSGFKLVVGGDGAWSRARKLITSATPEYSGVTFLQTTLPLPCPVYPRIEAAAGKGTYAGLGYNQSIIAQRQSNGSYTIYIAFKLPEHWSKTHAADLADSGAFRKKLMQQDFHDWTDDLKNLIECSEGPFYAWPLYAMPPSALNWKPVPGVALIGDAAHVSTPWQGEGVNVGMQDSMDLARAIVKYGMDRLDEAVAEYEAIMLPRGRDLILRSAESQGTMCGPDAPQEMRERFGETEQNGTSK